MTSAKVLAQQIAKQIAQEPLEVLKTAREQTTGMEAPRAQETAPASGNPDEQKKSINDQQELQDKMKSTRRMEALNRELEDIHKQDIFKELQAKVTGGEEIPLEDYPELSMEQREVLKAQMEAVKNQIAMQKAQGGQILEQPASKPSRRFGSTRKQAAEREKTRVEKPVPPSG